jgi:hypothetical protein
MKKNKNEEVKRGAGRPSYVPVFPKSVKWTVADWVESNKGKCSKLTLVKFKNTDMFNEEGNPIRNSKIVKVDGEFRKPNSAAGRGRKQEVFALRSRLAGVKVASVKSTPKKANPATVSISTHTVDDYEAKKAALLAPSEPQTVTEYPSPVEVVNQTEAEPIINNQ